MSKKVLAVIAVVLVIMVIVPSVAYAYKKMTVVAETNDGTWVQSFTDNGNRCYVVERHTKSLYPVSATSDSNALSISCVKEDK